MSTSSSSTSTLSSSSASVESQFQSALSSVSASFEKNLSSILSVVDQFDRRLDDLSKRIQIIQTAQQSAPKLQIRIVQANAPAQPAPIHADYKIDMQNHVQPIPSPLLEASPMPALNSVSPATGAEFAAAHSQHVNQTAALSSSSSLFPVHHHLFRYSSDSLVVSSSGLSSVQRKLHALVEGGADDLIILSDFDRTLSPAVVRAENSSFNTADSKGHITVGDMSYSSHGVLEKSPFMPESYRLETKAMLDHYLPIEYSTAISDNERLTSMVEWWNRAHQLLIANKVSRSIIKKSVINAINSGHFGLRREGAQLFEIAAKLNIPFIILSAGLGNVIEAYLKQVNLLTDNVLIISNWMQFAGEDEQAPVISFPFQLIHSMNKSYQAVVAEAAASSKHKHKLCDLNLEQRSNVLLLGDNLLDVKMIEGKTCVNECLKVGFLNNQDHLQQRRYEYSNTFDVVIENDGTFQFVADLLRDIENKSYTLQKKIDEQIQAAKDYAGKNDKN